MKVAKLTAGEGKHRVEAVVVHTERGTSLTVCTAEYAHIGATALAQPRASLDNPAVTSATVSSISVISHEDDYPARRMSKAIAAATKQPSVVTCGLHVEQASERDIELLLQNATQICDDALALVTSSHEDAVDDMVVLVDGFDRDIGSAPKWQAHAEGLLHRAFSVVLLRATDSGPELLLAKRAAGKYHSGGLWANSCCSHPREGESVIDAARRRVREELGCEAQGLWELDAFAYRAEVGNGLCEYEYDHLLAGECAGELAPNPAEVSEVRWVGLDELAAELASVPTSFAAWAPMMLTLVMNDLRR